MLRHIISWLNGAAARPPASDALPDEVKTAIAGATVIDRGQGDVADLIVMPAGFGGFRFSSEAARTWLQAAFPELTEAQIARAMRYLASHVKERQGRAEQDQLAGSTERTSWTAWTPLAPLRHSER
jgi:hypothetical protein